MGASSLVDDQDVGIVRDVVDRRDFLAPSRDQAGMVLYYYGLETTRNGQRPVALMSTSDRLGVMLTDTCGERSSYTQACHNQIARARNDQIGRESTFWAAGGPQETVMLGVAQTVAYLAELYCRPVEDGLVERIEHWDGAKVVPDQWGTTVVVDRPAVRDGSRTRLPARVEFTPMPPAILLEEYGLVGAIRVVNDAIASRQATLNATRLKRTGSSRVLGRRGCAALNPLGRRAAMPRRPNPPPFAGTRAQIAVALAERELRHAFYRQCRELFAAGSHDVVFPAGTVMFRKLGAYCDPLAPSQLSIPPFRHIALPPPRSR